MRAHLPTPYAAMSNLNPIGEREIKTHPKDTEQRVTPAEPTRRRTVGEAQDEVISMINSQHPEWVQENDECPSCVIYEYELAEIYR